MIKKRQWRSKKSQIKNFVCSIQYKFMNEGIGELREIRGENKIMKVYIRKARFRGRGSEERERTNSRSRAVSKQASKRLKRKREGEGKSTSNTYSLKKRALRTYKRREKKAVWLTSCDLSKRAENEHMGYIPCFWCVSLLFSLCVTPLTSTILFSLSLFFGTCV